MNFIIKRHPRASVWVDRLFQGTTDTVWCRPICLLGTLVQEGRVISGTLVDDHLWSRQ